MLSLVVIQIQGGAEHAINIPPPTNQTDSSSSSDDEDTSIHLLILCTTQMVLSIGTFLLIFKVHKLRVPLNLFAEWLLVYSFVSALMLPLLYFQRRTARTRSLSEKTAKKFIVLHFLYSIISCFFLAWFLLGCRILRGPVVSEPSDFERWCAQWFPIGCLMLILWAADCMILLSLVRHNPIRGPETAVLPVHNSEAKEMGAAETMERSLSGEDDEVCCICLNQCADNEELRKLPCCGHLFHVDCVDKWLKKKARCPLCQSDLGGHATS